MQGAHIMPWNLHSISDIQLCSLFTDEGIKVEGGLFFFFFFLSPEVHHIGLVLFSLVGSPAF